MHHTGRIIKSYIGEHFVKQLSILSYSTMDQNGLHFARSFSAPILNDGIVLPMLDLFRTREFKEGITERRESHSLRHNKLTQFINNNMVFSYYCGELLTTQDNDYSLDVTTILTSTTINFKNVIEQGSSDG